IPLFIKAYSEGIAPKINGDGEQSRDFTYIANVVHGNLLAADAPDAAGKVFNVACNGSITVNHLANEISKLTGHPDLKPIYGPDRSGDVKHSRAAIEKAKKYLNYEPIVSFEEGLKKTVEFYMEHGFGK
ncbi:MAG: GDP-mannose 4,6-dehydratase, partial [Candidatus Sabulitectum sp.]|nr:GDP-mannose 4,6-dehydratase [Candidatus Sabulitectum sp.]